MTENILISKYRLNSMKLQDTGNMKQISPFQNALEKSRLEQLNTIAKFLTEIRRNLELIKTEVFNPLRDRSDRESLKQKLLDMENKISNVKETIKEELYRLLIDEMSVTKELQFFEQKLDEWSKPINSQLFKPAKQSIYKITRGEDDNPITEFQKFLSANGGHYGGWEEQDHLIFLRERNKYKGKAKFLSVVHTLLPGFLYNDIEEHEEWYKKYEELKHSQKEAIQKWKTQKLSEQDRKEETENEKKETKITKKSHKKDIAERIRKWKEQQMIKKAEEEERKREEEERLKEERRKQKEIQMMKKMAVTEYKNEKLKRLQAEMFQEQENKRKWNSRAERNFLLKSFRIQDNKFVERKKILRLQTESKGKGKLETIKLVKPSLDVVLRRDPKRVLRPTLIWSQHCQRSEETAEKPNPVFDLNSIPRLAIPEWRKELQ